MYSKTTHFATSSHALCSAPLTQIPAGLSSASSASALLAAYLISLIFLLFFSHHLSACLPICHSSSLAQAFITPLLSSLRFPINLVLCLPDPYTNLLWRITRDLMSLVKCLLDTLHKTSQNYQLVRRLCKFSLLSIALSICIMPGMLAVLTSLALAETYSQSSIG